MNNVSNNNYIYNFIYKKIHSWPDYNIDIAIHEENGFTKILKILTR